MAKYEGPADNFIYKDRTYHPGDNIPMTKEEVLWHVLNNHRFEGDEPAATVPSSADVVLSEPAPKK